MYQWKRVKGNDTLRKEVKGHFKDLYKESSNWRPTLDGLEFNMLEDQDRALLEREFSKEEILKGLMHFKGAKCHNFDP